MGIWFSYDGILRLVILIENHLLSAACIVIIIIFFIRQFGRISTYRPCHAPECAVHPVFARVDQGANPMLKLHQLSQIDQELAKKKNDIQNSKTRLKELSDHRKSRKTESKQLCEYYELFSPLPGIVVNEGDLVGMHFRSTSEEIENRRSCIKQLDHHWSA